MYTLYNLLYGLGALLMAPYYAWRYRGSAFLRASWRERLGLLPRAFEQSQRESIWVHAVSVGETLAVSSLVRELQRYYPERKIFLSHVTPTGREAGEKRMPEIAGRFYLPLDLSGPVKRALARLRPRLLLVVETELWPNLLRWAHRYGTRVVLVNARLSDRSLRGYRRFRFFMRRVLGNVDWIFAQTLEDAERFCDLGALPERVLALGNLKFDVQPPPAPPSLRLWSVALRSIPRRPVLIAASTMPGEEEILLGAWREVRRLHARALLILAPRHPARFREVADLLAGRGVACVRRTELSASLSELRTQLAKPDVLLLDSIGELAGIFELADVVLMGGSLVPEGGHNLLEPAWARRAVIFGPYMNNFRDAAALFLDAGAAIQVADSRELVRETLELLDDADRRESLGEAARLLVERQSGATMRILERLESLLEDFTPTHTAGGA